MRVDLRGRHTGIECRPHVRQMGRQKQVGVERPQVTPRRLSACEAAALNGQAVMLRRAEHAHARDRVVAREDHHLHALCIGVVERQQLAHQRKGHAGFGRRLQAIELQLHVGPVVALLKHLVFFFKVEQGA